MAIHASERFRNILRTLGVTLAAVGLGGAVLVPDGDERGPGADVTRWVRFSVQEVTGEYAGRVAGAVATRERYLVSVEVWCKGAQFDAVGEVDAVDAIAESVAYALSYATIQLRDYVGDPVGAPAVTDVYLRSYDRALPRRLDPADGYQRRLVAVPFTLFSRHTG